MTACALSRSVAVESAPAASWSDQEWARRCAECLRGLDGLISAADADELAGEMRSHRRWRDLVPAEAARRLFAYTFA